MILNSPSILVFAGVSCFFGFSWLRESFHSHPDADVWVEWLCWAYLAVVARILRIKRSGTVCGDNAEENGRTDVEPWNLKLNIYVFSALVARVSMQFTSYHWLLVCHVLLLPLSQSDNH